MKKLLTIVLSLCLLCFPVSVSAEDEDLLSHYTGDDEAYCDFLFAYFRALHEEERQQHPYSFEYYYDYLPAEETSREMANMYNATRSDFEHPYLCGTISEETGEITITGLRAAGYGTLESAAMTPIGWFFPCVTNLVIPDEIDGRPVTKIEDRAFYGHTIVNGSHRYLYEYVQSVTIGNNVREIGKSAFRDLYKLNTLHLGDNVQIVGDHAFESNALHEITSWGNSLQYIGESAFLCDGQIGMEKPVLPLPETVQSIGYMAFFWFNLPNTYVVPKSVQKMDSSAFAGSCVTNLVLLNKDMEIIDSGRFFAYSYDNLGNIIYFMSYEQTPCLYCYDGSMAETFAKESGDPYSLIDGDSLLWDGEAVEGNVLHKGEGMTEAELREHLRIDGTSSEIQIDGLQDGKVVQGTTITLFHTIAQAPGKVYTVGEVPKPVSAQIETMPTKTSYIYKETFDPSGLSLRVTYDNGDEAVVTDGITCTNTDLHIGANTITATYETVSATFPVTVRAPQAVRAAVETLPTKTNYIYKEPFNPSGLSLRVTYDNGDEAVVTDGITCTNTDMHIGANTITATYENVNTTFPVTVRYTWWQTLIRIFLFGFLWY